MKFQFIRNKPLFGWFLFYFTCGVILYYWSIYNLSYKPLVKYSDFNLALFIFITVVLGILWWLGTNGLNNYFTQNELINKITSS